jgi:YidC/Oxa1 family membrane protein insertase
MHSRGKMNNKVWIIILVVLVGFFVVQKCTEKKKPNYDQVMQEERAKNAEEFNQKKSVEVEKKRKAALEAARKTQGERKQEQRAVLETKDFRAEFSTRGGTLAGFTLKDSQYLEAPRDWNTGLRDEKKDLAPVDLVTTNTRDYEQYNPLRFEILSGLDNFLADSDYELVEKSNHSLVFKYTQSDLPIVVYKKFEIDPDKSPFQVWLTIRVTNTSDAKVAFRAGVSQHGYQHQHEASGGMFSKQPNLLQGICKTADDKFATAWNDSGLEKPYSGVGEVSFAGVETNYFLAAMVPSKDVPVSCHVTAVVHQAESEDAKWGRIVSELRFAETELVPGQSQIYRIKNYLGPKRYRLLQSLGYHLEQSVDFGVLWPICQVLLTILFFFQSFVSNWGVAIILLTVLVKVVLMPLTHKSFQSAERMKALKPEVDKISEKFKDDAAAKQKATMAMYKENKVNPLGGCIPSLLQMPIWFALFSTLRTSPELYRAPFFGWIHDLSNPIVMGALMFVQQKYTPMTGDSAQAKMMLYFMPIMFTAMMLFLPSGLTLYILVNTVLSIGHQMFIHYRSAAKARAL